MITFEKTSFSVPLKKHSPYSAKLRCCCMVLRLEHHELNPKTLTENLFHEIMDFLHSNRSSLLFCFNFLHQMARFSSLDRQSQPNETNDKRKEQGRLAMERVVSYQNSDLLLNLNGLWFSAVQVSVLITLLLVYLGARARSRRCSEVAFYKS